MPNWYDIYMGYGRRSNGWLYYTNKHSIDKKELAILDIVSALSAGTCYRYISFGLPLHTAFIHLGYETFRDNRGIWITSQLGNWTTKGCGFVIGLTYGLPPSHKSIAVKSNRPFCLVFVQLQLIHSLRNDRTIIQNR